MCIFWKNPHSPFPWISALGKIMGISFAGSERVWNPTPPFPPQGKLNDKIDFEVICQLILALSKKGGKNRMWKHIWIFSPFFEQKAEDEKYEFNGFLKRSKRGKKSDGGGGKFWPILGIHH